MKVLQLCKFFPPVVGGMESVVRELAEGLARRAVDVDVLCANVERKTLTERRDAGYRVTRASSWGRVLGTSVAPAMLGLSRELQMGCDIVHVHMPDPMAALAIWRSPPSGKLVVHWHSDVVRQRIARRLYEPLQHWLLRRADAIIATSQPYADSSPWLRPWASKTTVIPIGIGDNATRRDPAGAADIRRRFGNRRIVFSLGRMSRYKGFDVLIDAAALLPEHCVIVVGGEGALLEDWRRKVLERRLTGKIVFIGSIPEESLPAYFEAADVFCLASTTRAEAFGVVVAEALSMSRPVVATEIEGSGVPWVNVSGSTGLNVPPGDSAALAGAIAKIVDDRQLAIRMGDAARARYLELLSASRMVDSLVRLYGNVLVHASPGPHSSAG